MGTEQAIATVSRFFDRMGAFDWDAMAACVAEDITRVGPFRDVKSGRQDYDGECAVAQLSETLLVEGRPRRTDEAIVLDLGPDGLIHRVEVYLQRAYFVDHEPEVPR